MILVGLALVVALGVAIGIWTQTKGQTRQPSQRN
jgi:hypothetical protein